MVSTIQNTDVKQKDADHSLVVALASRAVFDSSEGDDIYTVAMASPLLQVMQRVNECLLDRNPSESLLFDVILITTDSQQQQQSSRLIRSTSHHSLQVSRFCFSSEEDFVESLLKNNVQLFLTTDINEMAQASHKGIVSAVLDQQIALCPSDQLRVMFCEDVIMRHSPDPTVQQPIQRFLGQLGEMRQRFDIFNSPLSIVLVTLHSGRENCSSCLKTLRSCGVNVDEAYCLAGAPQGAILSVVRPHILLSDCISGLEE